MSNKSAAVIGSFIGDSLSLASHWIYDAKEIEKKFGFIEDFADPLPDSYHAKKKKGDFTHYGDQMFVLLESVSSKKGFDLEDFKKRWVELFDNYDDYVDSATKITLQNMEEGKSPCGSDSQDFSAVGRIAILAYFLSGQELYKAVEECISLTHNNPEVISSGVFFAKVLERVLSGQRPTDAINEEVKNSLSEDIIRRVKSGLTLVDDNPERVFRLFGTSCATLMAFPGVIYTIAKYEDDFKEAMQQTVLGGGDNASRAHVVGMILGAYHGLDKIPKNWVRGMNEYDQMQNLLNQL